MKIPTSVNIPSIALALICVGSFGAPQAAQAHHHPVHSTEQAIINVTRDTSATVKQVAVRATDAPSRTYPLEIGGAILISFVGLGLYKARKQQSV